MCRLLAYVETQHSPYSLFSSLLMVPLFSFFFVAARLCLFLHFRPSRLPVFLFFLFDVFPPRLPNVSSRKTYRTGTEGTRSFLTSPLSSRPPRRARCQNPMHVGFVFTGDNSSEAQSNDAPREALLHASCRAQTEEGRVGNDCVNLCCLEISRTIFRFFSWWW